MDEYRKELRRLSDRLVEAQRPIRIVDSVKWHDSIPQFLKAHQYKKIPPLGPETYESNPLRFDPAEKIEELSRLDEEIQMTLGADDPLGRILDRNTTEYISVVKMLQSRGTPDFYRYSRQLYGSSLDTFLDKQTAVFTFGQMLSEILGSLDDRLLGPHFEKKFTAMNAVDDLVRRFKAYFPDQPVRVILSDGILADAAAGADYVKIRDGSNFSSRDIDILEVHEGWVHLGSALNGQKQPYATWLAKGPPCVTAIQEGLAVLMEMISFVTYPTRARKLIHRLLACHLMETGGTILDVFEFFRSQGFSEEDALFLTERIGRGGDGKTPFTKDISYCKGFILIFNFMRAALRAGRVEYLPYLFVGKTTLEDIPVLYRAAQEGHVTAPFYLPAQFRDLNALATWMSYSNFFNRIHLENVYDYYDPIFKSGDTVRNSSGET